MLKRRVWKTVWVAGMAATLGAVALADKAELEQKAKDTKVTMEMKNVAPEDALKEVSKQTGIPIETRGDWRNVRRFTVTMEEAQTIHVLGFICRLARLEYRFTDQAVEVWPKPEPKENPPAKTPAP